MARITPPRGFSQYRVVHIHGAISESLRAVALLAQFVLDTPVLAQIQRAPTPLRTTTDTEVERRGDTLAFSSEGQPDPVWCLLGSG